MKKEQQSLGDLVIEAMETPPTLTAAEAEVILKEGTEHIRALVAASDHLATLSTERIQ